MSRSDVLRLVVLLWFLVTGAISLNTETRTARRQERPMRRRVVVINAIGLGLVSAALVLLVLELLGITD